MYMHLDKVTVVRLEKRTGWRDQAQHMSMRRRTLLAN